MSVSTETKEHQYSKATVCQAAELLGLKSDFVDAQLAMWLPTTQEISAHGLQEADRRFRRPDGAEVAKDFKEACAAWKNTPNPRALDHPKENQYVSTAPQSPSRQFFGIPPKRLTLQLKFIFIL